MNKTNIKTIYLAGSLLLLLVACSSEEPVNNGEGARLPLEIGASISEPVVSRALGAVNYEKSSFAENDVIKIGTSATSLEASGTSYTYKKDVAQTLRWLPTNGGDGLTTTGSGYYYASYSPIGYIGILADQSATAAVNYIKSNRLITDATPVSVNRINFSFSPAAAKVTVIVDYTDDVHVGVKVQLTGSDLTGASSSNPITFYPVTATGKTHMYVAIVYPGVSKQYKIAVTSKATASSGTEDTKTYPSTGNVTQTLEAGHNYIYNFTSTFGLILNNVTVEAFKPGTGNGTGTDWGAS